MANISKFIPVNTTQMFDPADDSAPTIASIPQVYEAPRIESVMTAQDLEREMLYAGSVTPPPWSNIPD